MHALTEPNRLRTMLRRHASGVVVITAFSDRPAGFTATTFSSVSLHPPLISFCLNRSASVAPAIAAARHVGVHLLTGGQDSIARKFATSGINRFAESTRWHIGPRGVPVLEGMAAVMICAVVRTISAGSHLLFLAEPEVGESVGDAGPPLLYHMGRYLVGCLSSTHDDAARSHL